VADRCHLTGTDKVDVEHFHTAEDFGFLRWSIFTVGHKTVPNDEWTFVDGLQSWIKLVSFVQVWMLSIFLFMGCRICSLDAFGVAGLLDSPGT
jgi:hypothetical protein